MSQLKVLIACPNPSDPTSLYRGLGPWSALQKQYGDVQITQGGQDASAYDWNHLRQYDLLFFQRPGIPTHQAILERAKALRVPIWIDYDDDLLSVPPENPTFDLYGNPGNRLAMENCLKLADLVTVSTQRLADKYKPANANIEVIPNALDDFFLEPRKIRIPRQKIVLWRGSHTHMHDLLDFREEILNCYQKNPGWKWYFLGYNPWYITSQMTEGDWGKAPWGGTLEYFNLIQNLQAPIQIVPLRNDEFNQSKSNIAWIEGTLAGSAVLAPDWGSWAGAGPIRYSDVKDFGATLNQMLRGEINLEAAHEKSLSTIHDMLRLSHMNRRRYDLASKLVARTSKSRIPESML